MQGSQGKGMEQSRGGDRRESGYYPDDEISLVDLWRTLVRRKSIIGVATVATVAFGLLVAFIKPDTYVFSSTLEIGHYPTEAGARDLAALDSVENALSKLQDGYIPEALRRYMDEGHEESRLRVTARNPRGSNLVVIEVKGTLDEGESILRVLNYASNQLIEDHRYLLDIQRQQLDSRLEQARLELSKYEDERMFRIQEQERLRAIERTKLELNELLQQQELVESRIKRLDDMQRLLEQQIKEIRQSIEVASETRRAAVANVGDPANAMTLLMIDSDIQQNRNRLATLDERLHIGLPNEFDELQKRLDDILRAQSNMKTEIEARESELERFRIDWERSTEAQRQTVRAVEARLNAARDTRVVTQPARSLEPEGPGKSIILALSLFLGLMLGVFAAFFAEFLRNAREETA